MNVGMRNTRFSALLKPKIASTNPIIGYDKLYPGAAASAYNRGLVPTD